MRLRLVVRRHNLPDAVIVWPVEPSENPTISQLLEHVNEVIPLESGGEWGLEDYSVEIKGSDTNFECLHFQLVRTVLHEDDEVLIRPLLSHDLKLRKASGRHQISSDGKHLYDGWVFGRPRPRGSIDRPAIDIPPRKRRRITYDDDYSESSIDEEPIPIEGQAQVVSDQNGNRQMILSAEFEDDDDHEEDEDYEPGADEDEDEGEEEDDDEDEDGDGASNETDNNHVLVNGLRDNFDGEVTFAQEESSGLKSEVQKLHDAFPNAPLSLCKNVLIGCDKDLGSAWDTLSQVFQPSVPRKTLGNQARDQESSRTAKTRSKAKESSKSEKNSLLQYYDEHGLPEGSISTGKALSNMAKIVSSNDAEQADKSSRLKSARRITRSKFRTARSVRFVEDNHRTKASTLLAHDISNSDNEDYNNESSVIEPDLSSSESSGWFSDSNKGGKKDEDESTSSEESDTNSEGSETDSDSDSDSDSDESPEEVSSKPTNLEETVAPKTSPSSKSLPREQKTKQTGTVLPGQGKNSTRLRNQRRRAANLLRRYKDKGILPAGTSIKEMEQLGLSKIQILERALEMGVENQTEDSQTSNRQTGKAADKAGEFEGRRQQLLSSLASGGVEVGSHLLLESVSALPLEAISKGPDIPETMPEPDTAALEIPSISSVNEGEEKIKYGGSGQDATSLGPNMVITPAELSAPPSAEPTSSTTNEPTSHPRRKIDLGAAGRLLFGALGVRAPKNKADHGKVRNDLMKDIRPNRNISKAETASAENESSVSDTDPDAWRKVINLRAVECCYDGVELSPAPFPFVQRWDPQQQGTYSRQGSRGGKGKRAQRNQSQYYDEEPKYSKKRKRNRDFHDAYDGSSERHPTLDNTEIPDYFSDDQHVETDLANATGVQVVGNDGTDGAVNDQIMKDVQEASNKAADSGDLPMLPDDVSTLPSLNESGVKPGMIITFKQLVLSEATNWQPQISSYRTAVVLNVSENGKLELRLAKRDREQIEKYYDTETGERIYGKFDMPTDDDDQDEKEDDGFLEIGIDEFIEPKIVQVVAESLGVTEHSPTIAQNKNSTGADDSTTLGHTDSAETSKLSVAAPPEANQETTDHYDVLINDNDSPSIRGDLVANDADNSQSFSVSENTRGEISVLIKEAGFRTSIPSSVLRAEPQFPGTPRSSSEKGSYSPRFNGFDSSSSQSIPDLSSPSPLDTKIPPMEDIGDANGYSVDELENKLTLPTVKYPKLSLPSSLASQVSDRGRQPDYPLPGDEMPHQFDDMDSLLVAQEDLQINHEELPSLQPGKINDKSSLDHGRSSPSDYFESPSPGVLPTLAEVFSTARSSIESKPEMQTWLSHTSVLKEAKKIEESCNREMEALDAELEEAEDEEQITPKALTDSRGPLTVSAGTQKSSIGQFTIPPGSQQVDLTLSSDAELLVEAGNLSDSYDESYGLPSGPGWVEKKTRTTRRQTTGNSQSSSQRQIKTRSTRRKTMTKF